MKKSYIIMTALISCILLYVVEQIMVVNYLVKTIIKILAFLIVPIMYMKRTEDIKDGNFLNFDNVNVKDLKIGLMLGIIAFFIIILAYFMLKENIDLNIIALELQRKLKITPKNFILVGLYITFCNSFIEEFFFRNFIFLNLYNLGYSKLSYVFSSVLFGIYHIAIFKTWFNPYIMGIALFGLISVGFVFNWLNLKSKNILNSWIVHILADSAIIVIGMNMFNIL